jgi:hypothetical protein
MVYRTAATERLPEHPAVALVPLLFGFRMKQMTDDELSNQLMEASYITEIPVHYLATGNCSVSNWSWVH